MFDSHAHILSEYYEDIDKLINELKSKNVIGVINCATNIKNSKEVLELSKIYNDFLFPAIGIHPEDVNDNVELLEKIIKENKIIAIGEIGLDYYWESDNKEQQKELFLKQLKLAEKYKLPVIIHSRKATKDCLNMIKNTKLKGIMHCFSGSYEIAREFIKCGFKLGIGGVLTFKNSKLYEIVDKIDLENIVLETDSPYLTPEPFRGQKNDPSNVYYVAKKIAEIKKITIEEVISQTTKNIGDIFDI